MEPSVTPQPGIMRSTVLLSACLLLPLACSDGCNEPPVSADGSGSQPGTDGPATSDGDSLEILCVPDEVRCNGQSALETCAPTGLEWVSENCETNEFCDPCTEDESCAADRCVGPCDIEAELPSSAGCSFIANRQLHLNQDEPDGLVVTNPNEELVATVQLFRTPDGLRKEDPVGDPITLQPGEDAVIELDADFVLGDTSQFRTGGTYRVESDVPITAYLHSPLTNSRGNDSSLLLPETTARRDYVVPSYAPHHEQPQNQGEPSYFEIVALEDFTEVTWTPPVDTAGNGINIDFVPAGEASSVLDMNRFDTVRIAASSNVQKNPDLRDVSGTVIHSSKPIWVVGASRCSRVPVRDFPERGRCDPLQEVLIPLDYWGERYVAAHSPDRTSERHWWRIFSASNDVRITAEGNLGCTEPVLTAENCSAPNEFDGTGCTLDARGSWIEVDVPNGCSFFLDSDNTGAFMPVQYLQSGRVTDEPIPEATLDGDPAMSQYVPVEQFLTRYVFSTGVGFDFHYVQVIAEVGGPSVFIDYTEDDDTPVSISGFNPVTDTWEVADHPLTQEGPYVIFSGAPFGIVQYGYSSSEPSPNCQNELGDNDVCLTSYAYPGGMKSERINIP